MELTIDKIEEICLEAIKELTKEVKLDDNLSLIGIFKDELQEDPITIVGCGLYSKSQEDVIILW